MIFVTVGSDRPFDRLIQGVDRWCINNSEDPVFAQIASGVAPRHMQWIDYLDPISFRDRCADATIVVAHAGMGTILTTLELRTPVVLFPRRLKYGEHTSEHQLATARKMRNVPGITVAEEVPDLLRVLDSREQLAKDRSKDFLQSGTSQLVESIREFVENAHSIDRRK